MVKIKDKIINILVKLIRKLDKNFIVGTPRIGLSYKERTEIIKSSQIYFSNCQESSGYESTSMYWYISDQAKPMADIWVFSDEDLARYQNRNTFLTIRECRDMISKINDLKIGKYVIKTDFVD